MSTTRVVRQARRTVMSKMRSNKPGAPRRDHEVSAAGNPRASVDPLRHWMHDGLRGLAQGSAVLAVGCEQAFLAPQLAEYAAEVTVLDTSGAQIGQLGRRFPEISFAQHDPANPLPFARDTFDAVWCCDFLDRIFDPTVVLRELHRVLVPGGRLLVTVPDHGSLRHQVRTYFNPGDALPANVRIREFTKRSLAKLMQEGGFAAVQTESVSPLQGTADGFLPRNLLLRAKKGRGVQLMSASAPRAGALGAGRRVARGCANPARAA